MGEKEKGQGMVIRRPPDKPRGVPLAPDEPVPPGFSLGDARGEAPCIRKLKSPPSPPGKGGGGMGAEKKEKAV